MLKTMLSYFGGILTTLAFSSTSLAGANYEALFFSVINNNHYNTTDKQTEKLVALSSALIGAIYEDGSLGEGNDAKYDRDPLIRFDVFDCTTYVEAVLAGTLSTSENEFLSNLKKLRYKDSKVKFIYRNHFPSLDWIPNNRQILTDMTKQVAPDAYLIAKAVIDKPAWYQHMDEKRLTCPTPNSSECQSRLTALKNEAKHFAPETAELAYVPLTAIFQSKQGSDQYTVNQALLDRIPTGSVINMVRPNWQIKKWIGTNMNVSHQSIAIRKDCKLFLRHASQTHKMVTDEDFIEYFSQYLKGSSLKGFNVLTLSETI